MSSAIEQDSVVLNLWHPLAAVSELKVSGLNHTLLLDQPLSFVVLANGQELVWLRNDKVPAHALLQGLPEGCQQVRSQQAYGYIWACLGDQPTPLFPVPEYAEHDRRNMNAATVGAQTSAPRAIENFLDMGHFPFVHTGTLGAQPHTEVKNYDVEVKTDSDEILATRCVFMQPKAAATSTGWAEVDYIYRVPHPYCALLYKSSPNSPERMDVIAVFLQPMTEVTVRAHMLLSILDDSTRDEELKLFQIGIFGQDKPILENQRPKRLPLDPRAEVPIRADQSAIVYRRWLTQKGVHYGVIRPEN